MTHWPCIADFAVVQKPSHGGYSGFRVCLAALSLLLFLAGTAAAAFAAVGTIRRVNAEGHVLQIYANGQERTLTIAKDVQVLGTDGKPLPDGLLAADLKAGAEVTISVDRQDGGPIVRVVRLGRQVTDAAPRGGRPSLGLKPLNEMTADERYKGEDGGLYGGGRNDPPPACMAAAREQSARIVPLDADGRPSAQGKVGLVSISMSNATLEFSRFKEIADRDPRKSPRVAIVDCAQGGQAMAEWVAPDARPWGEAQRRLAQASVSPAQVQVTWVKLANKGPRGDLTEHGRKLEADTLAVLHNAKARFPNLRIAYLGSRIYGGYSNGTLNPEPYAYEGAFAVRWLIQDQLKGAPELRFDGAAGEAKAPLLLWGPYLWADGVTARHSDGLVWERKDIGPDGTHPSESGRQKVADLLLGFFTNDALARTWFCESSSERQGKP